MTMFVVCRRGIPERQLRCGGRVGEHTGGTDEEVCHLSVQYARSTAAVCGGRVGGHAGVCLTFLGAVCQWRKSRWTRWWN